MFPLRVTTHLSSLSYMEIIYHVILWLVPEGHMTGSTNRPQRHYRKLYSGHIVPSPAVTLGSRVLDHDPWETAARASLQVSRLHAGHFWKLPLFAQICWGGKVSNENSSSVYIYPPYAEMIKRSSASVWLMRVTRDGEDHLASRSKSAHAHFLQILVWERQERLVIDLTDQRTYSQYVCVNVCKCVSCG